MTQAWTAVHRAAEILPMLPDDELDQLVADIKQHGLREPVWLWRDPDDGTVYLLDGRNRVAACQRADVSVSTRHYTGDDPVSFAVSLNVQRRHLTVGQKASVGARMLPLLEEQGRKKMVAAASATREREAAQRTAEAERNAPPIEFQGVADLPHLDDGKAEPQLTRWLGKGCKWLTEREAWDVLKWCRRLHEANCRSRR